MATSSDMTRALTGQPETNRQPTFNRTRSCLFLAILYAIVLAATRPPSMGDTIVSATDIASRLGASPFGRDSSLWESGHLLWRPIGWAVTTVVSSFFPAMQNWTPFMLSGAVLVGISLLSSVITVVLWYLLLIDLAVSPRAAFLVALAAAFGHGFLLYAHSGCSYIPGLTCLTASLYFLRKNKVAG